MNNKEGDSIEETHHVFNGCIFVICGFGKEGEALQLSVQRPESTIECVGQELLWYKFSIISNISY